MGYGLDTIELEPKLRSTGRVLMRAGQRPAERNPNSPHMLRASPSALFLIAGLLGGLLTTGAAWSQPGTILTVQKISNSVGGFTASVDNSDEVGGAVAWLGDLDGPGPSVAAFAAGAIGDDDGGTDRGAVYVMFVDSTGTVLSNQKISHSQGFGGAGLGNADEFGGSVAWLGDLDGPGPSVAALAVGAVGDDDGGLNRGCVYIIFLNAAGGVLSFQKISDTAGGFTTALDNSDEFGGAVTSLGDVDGTGPGLLTLAVGAVGDDDGGSDVGAVYLLALSAAGTVLSEQKISDTAGNFAPPLDDLDDFGGALTSFGDLDGLGPARHTLVVGTSADDDGGTDRGATYVCFLEGEILLDAPGPGSRANGLGLAQPNPFRPRTTIPFRLGESAHVRVLVSDVHGRIVRRLVDGGYGPGDHQVAWNGVDDAGQRLGSGVYFVRMSINGRALMGSRKVVLLE